MKTILVVDDDIAVNEMLVQFLQNSGFQATGIFDGSNVRAAMKDVDYDLVITDLIMPNKEGIETILSLRNSGNKIPIIAISGGGRTRPEASLHMAKLLGANYTLTKPVALSTLLDTVRDCLGLKE